MPGYEFDRFVDITETEKTDLTCSICHDILRNPVVTNCCLQTFCEDCIHEWLNTKNTCPHDRKDLNASQLTRPPRILMNLLGRMKIHCNYKENGCDEILLLDTLSNHVKTCRFVKKICKKCHFQIHDDHDCLKTLLQINKNIEDKYKTALDRIASLEKENAKCMQTIESLSTLHPSNSSQSQKMSDNVILTDARRYSNSLNLCSWGTTNDMNDKISIIVKDVLNKERSLYDVCKAIKLRVESKFEGLWQCSAFYCQMGSYSSSFDRKFFVKLIFGQLEIIVQKIKDKINLKKLAQHLTSGELQEEMIIEKTDMTEKSIKTLKNIVFDKIKTCNDWTEFNQHVCDELKYKFGGYWNCIVFKKFMGRYNVLYKAEKYTAFYISDIKFALYQTPT